MNILTEGVRRMPMRFALLVLSALALSASAALAHDVTPGDAGCAVRRQSKSTIRISDLVVMSYASLAGLVWSRPTHGRQNL